jgi:uncharacterized protein involved in exopolysaccharide biosynthesis
MSTTTKPDPNPRPSPGFFSRITMRWHLLLFLWLIITVPIVYLIHQLVEPTFEASSILRVSPTSFRLYEASRPEQIDFKAVEAYLNTQIGLITSDRALGPALESSEVVHLSTITSSDDPREFLREHLKVEIVKDAYLIRVALELPDRNQPAAIVNAVVQSYLQYNAEHQRSGNSSLRKALAEHIEEYKKQIAEKRDELKGLSPGGTVVPVPVISVNASGKVTDPTQPRLSTVTESQALRVADDIISTDLDLIKAKSVLEVAEAASNAGNDPHARELLSELRRNVAALVKQREYQAKYFEGLKVEKNIEKPAASDIAFVQRQIDILLRREEQVNVQLKQLEFEASQENVRVTLVDSAVVPNVPTNNDRITYMTAAPIVVLFALLGLALVAPVKGSRAWTGE